MDFFEKVKGIILEPARTFDASRDNTLKDALEYYIVITSIFSFFILILGEISSKLFGTMMDGVGMMAGANGGIAGAISNFLLLLILIVIGAFVGGAFIHIFVYIAGGRKGIVRTIIALMYADTPYLLFGWIPIIGLIAMIWSILLSILGIRQFQDLTTGRAILAILLPIIVVTIGVFVILMSAFILNIGHPGGDLSFS